MQRKKSSAKRKKTPKITPDACFFYFWYHLSSLYFPFILPHFMTITPTHTFYFVKLYSTLCQSCQVPWQHHTYIILSSPIQSPQYFTTPCNICQVIASNLHHTYSILSSIRPHINNFVKNTQSYFCQVFLFNFTK